MTRHIDLYRDLRPARPRGLRLAVIVLVLLVATAVLVLVQAVQTQRRLAHHQADLAQLRSATATLQRLLAQAAAATTAPVDEAAQVAAMESLAARLQAGATGRREGFVPALTALAQARTEGVWLTGINLDAARNSVALRGKAVDASRVPALLEALARQPTFVGTAFAQLELEAAADAGQGTTPAGAVQFHISAATDAIEMKALVTFAGNRSPREKWLAIGALVASTGVLLEGLLFGPLRTQQAQLVRDMAAARAQFEQLAAMARGVDAAPDAGLHSRRAAAQAQIQRAQAGLIEPGQMAAQLGAILARHPQLRVIGVRSQPPRLLDAAGAPLYEHALQVTVEGRYLELLPYLAALDAGPRRVVWRALHLEVPATGVPVTRIDIATLSREPIWLRL